MKYKKLWLLCLVALLGFGIAACRSSKLILAQEYFIVEYGDAISMNPKDYLVSETPEEVLNEAQVHMMLNKKFPTDIGVYEGSIVYKKESVKFKVEVKDTTAPEFVDFQYRLEVEQGYSGDITSYFTATDYSPVFITSDTSNVDFNTLGEYEMNVTASDTSRNHTTQKCIIVVKKK